jgi:NAD(P)-dependent dehydrogenase (short-subunit alcohol dehydrogenase family)
MRLQGKVCVVTGASRGGGRGIAHVLGEEGAVVYVTGRSVRGQLAVPDMPSTLEETAALVNERGGLGIPVRCDHTDDAQVQALFERIQREQGRLDVLVCNAWGGYLPYAEHMEWGQRPFWEQSMQRWDGMFTAGLRAHLVTCRFGLPLMLPHPGGLVALTTFTQGKRYLGNVFYDVAKNAVCRMARGLAEELASHEIAVVALSPGWMLVERMTGLSARERAQTESVEYLGRAVAALAADAAVIRRSGQTYAVGELARDYNFTDRDGRQPTAYLIEK